MKCRAMLLNMITFMLVGLLGIGTSFILPDSAQAGPPGTRSQAKMSINGGGGGNPGGPPPGGGTPGGGKPGNPGGGKPGGGNNTNINVNVNHHGGGKHGGPPPKPHKPPKHGPYIVGGVIAGLAIGAIVAAASMPPANTCTDIFVGGIMYRQCGPTWYQPYYQGTTIQYVVVNPPR